jgi:hypothetical protein
MTCDGAGKRPRKRGGDQVSLPARIATLAVAFVVVVGGAVFVVVHYLLGATPPTVDFTAGHVAGQPVNMTIQVDPINDASPHPDWASYFVKSPQTGRWVHSTIWQLPAHTRINVTAYEYDTCDPLRNQLWGRVTGTIGGVMSVSGEAYGLNGKSVSVVNSYATCGVAHTLTVPALGLNIPFAGVTYTASLKPRGCTHAPCLLSNYHTVTRFSFYTPGAGEYRWQCFIPCGLATVQGNGHAMSTLGFMAGFLKVAA